MEQFFLLCKPLDKFFKLSSPMSVVADLPIKLARKCVEAVGTSLVEENALERTTLDFGIDDEVKQVKCAKNQKTTAFK